ncbi:hypothetical protein [Streptomyces sp. NPDC006879]|uniref:hypothetical protein n=1 Tax=Streptomyces sp. NPDC006879 TaxID=3364767 RepID=UPI0036891AB7
MSHDDQYGYGDDGRIGGSGQTRTRLPEPPGDAYGGNRRPTRPSRGLVTVVGVVVLLIAAIAFANQKGGGPDATERPGTPHAAPTAPTGTRPVTGKNAQIPTGFPRNEQGAQSAAANYAVALVSADMLRPALRAEIVSQAFVANKTAELGRKFDQAYGKNFLEKAGLDANGNAPAGLTYISRTVPVGTKVIARSDGQATVDVWCTGMYGTAGVTSTNPVSSDWFTLTLGLRWENQNWKVETFAQKEGPAPVYTDRTASNAEEIAKAVEEYGGFTYAR